MGEAADPIGAILRRGTLILDGGLATELERLGADLSGGLWSARYLRRDPQLIRDVHTSFLEAGADCIASASYQATIQGFVAAGESEAGAVELLRRSVRLAVEERDRFWERVENRAARERPLVAASIGPYGAFLADGSEYTGAYELDRQGLQEFHRRRWRILAHSGADLIACETIPTAREALALQALLRETSNARGWISFCCRDGTHLADGTRLARAIEPLAEDPRIVALGVNCVAPRNVLSLIAEVRSATDKPIVVYPNSGERYDAMDGSWHGGDPEPELAGAAVAWREAGARLIGGCCRTGPWDIRALRRSLIEAD